MKFILFLCIFIVFKSVARSVANVTLSSKHKFENTKLPFINISEMLKSRQFAIDERRFVLNLRNEQEMTVTEIADVVQRVRGTVYNIINNPDKQRASAQSGRPCKLAEQDKRSILRKARNGKYTARQIFSSLNLPILLQHVRCSISSDPHLKWTKMKKVQR